MWNISDTDTGANEYIAPFYRPVIVIGGSSDRNQETAGAFQEFPQVPHFIILNTFPSAVNPITWASY